MSEPGLSDRERVIVMLEEGKISRQEAEQLLEALGEVDEVQSTLKAVDSEIRETAAQALENDSETDKNKEARAEKGPFTKETETSLKEKSMGWLVIEMLAGDLAVKLDPSLSEPKIISGKANLEKKDKTYIVQRSKTKVNNSGDPLKDLGTMVVGFISGLHGDLELAIPKGFAVEVNSKAGDVDIEGAAFLRANLLAGDLDAKNIGGIDLQMAAGDVDLSLLLLEGSHNIRLAAGDVDVRLMPGSSVKLEGSVSMGDFKLLAPESIEPSLEINKTMMGGDFKAELGEGNAYLNIDLSTGDIEVKIEHD